MNRKVLLVVIDALASRVVRPAVEEGRLPNIRALIESGRVAWDCASIFPSITPAATCSIISGRYPNEHAIGGDYWYNTETDEISYYGDDFWAIMREGVGKFFEDFLVRLNEDFLHCETAFQAVERAGMRAACLNYLWFHGEVEHDVRVPLLLGLLPGVPFHETVHGPTILALGDFVTTKLELSGERLKARGGLRNRFGFTDEATADYLLQLAQYGPLPNFTVAYFPNNDYESHIVGPVNAIGVVENVDRCLGELAGLFGGIAKMLAEVAVVIVGDHSQCDMKDESQGAAIELESLLGEYNVVPAGGAWSKDDELMICPNMRAAQIYLRRGYWDDTRRIVERLTSEPRVDQVLWREGRHGSGKHTFHVATPDRGWLTFWPGDGGEAYAFDDYGTRWAWEGSLETVDARVSGNRIHFGDYPNAFERIVGGFNETVSGDLWLTARPSYEFRIPDMKIHEGGSHGSLHLLDSTVPLVVAGVPEEFELPRHPRTVDVAPICLSLLGLSGARRAGEGHVDAHERH